MTVPDKNRGLLPETSSFLQEMRNTLNVAELLAMYTAAQIAIQVRTDSETILNHLTTTVTDRFGDKADAELGEAGLILRLRIDKWLAERRENPRSGKERRAEARDRAERAERVLGADHPEVRNSWERHYLEEARETDTYVYAVRNYRASLKKRGWPDRMDFRISLSSLNFATMLRRSNNPDELEEGEQITARNAAWRAAEYGPSHPYTSVAEGNRLIDELYRSEALHDFGGPTAINRDQVRKILSDAARLTKARRSVLGVHHEATIKALSYEARAHRLLGNPGQALAIAEKSLGLVMNYESKKDTPIKGILRVIAAEGYAAEADIATSNMTIAATSGLNTVAEAERVRAIELASTIKKYIDQAESDLARWPNEQVWLDRLVILRTQGPEQDRATSGSSIR